MSGARWLLVGLALAVGVGSSLVAAYDPAEESYDSTCYNCHYNWSPVPMRTMFNLRPLASQGKVGQPFEVSAQVQQAWVAKPPWPMLVAFDGVLDLSQAPSLTFANGVPPQLGVSTAGTIQPNPDQPDRRQEGYVTVQVPAGASAITLTLAPADTDPVLGPDVEMRVFAGRIRPSGTNETAVVDEAGRGQAERWSLAGPELAREGPGTWAVSGRVTPVDAQGGEVTPMARPLSFTVTLDAWFNSTDGRQPQHQVRTVEAGRSTALGWPVIASHAPGPGERVRITMNVTAHYVHKAPSVDWANFTKTVELEVGGSGGAVVLQPAGVAAVATPSGSTVSAARIGEAVGYMAALLLLSSIVSGGMLGKRNRQWLNGVFQSARRRVAFHNALSYFILLVAAAHTVLFLLESNYHWTLGLIWGSLANLSLAGLGLTGALQVPMIRRWDYATWRWVHYGLAVAVLVFTAVHMLLDGANFAPVQDALGWKDPLDLRPGQVAR